MSVECSAGNIPSGYKQTEVGVIPEDWDTATLSQHCSKLNVGFVGVCEPYYTSENNGIMLIRTGNLYGQKFTFQDLKYVTHSFHELNKKSQTRKGDILIARHGSSGSAVLVPSSIEEANTLNIVIIRTIANELDNVFAQYAINSDGVRKQVLEVTAGSTQGVINTGEIAKLIIPKPTINEQRAIAEALSDTDAFIESLEQLIAKKRQIKQGAMQELLTGKRRLLGFSGKWETKLIGDVLTIAHGKSQHAVIDKNGIYPILATGGQIGTANCFLYDKPSVLIGRKGTIDKPQFMDTPFWTVDTLFYSVIHEPNNAKFLFYRFCLIDWKQYNEASGVPSLNARTIESIELKIPSSAKEQNAIASILSDMDSEITALEEKLAKTRQIKQGMMQELLTGKIRLI